MSFYDQCIRLRNFYLAIDDSKIKRDLLTKLFSTAFNNDLVLDTLPILKPVYIDCSDMDINVKDIETALSQVLKDLDYTHFNIGYNNFPISHKVYFTIF